ncbi:MAG: Trk system potassium transporter TrkA [Phycisphaeraceae bacterium]|jgi:trk system potassium uptake protein|nr:Trk system potassium transporter TrkA [Phycisphaerae bacterium]MCP4013159.1 Trk system potassium transporter TrkA [Phycisphaeraceae bacterium]MCP4068785.1 Trk system potassium transporter TrkA [Phycisphaeraceae bacterium]MCP4797698.1 Trk system potassium transporter TrkA [Phycisphaeraceae bacterium]MCP4939695.1 Trk system potassium transporter TrkA [Phycisphaeraceae bacterium]
MRIVICGAGEVGSHAAEVLVRADHAVTIIDLDAERLRPIEDSIDARTVVGNCARADILLEAGVAGCDLLVAATDCDEVNLLTSALGKRIGATKTVARVHEFDFADRRGFDYGDVLEIDHLICPEFSTSIAIAQNIRNPAALAVEIFARGQVEMQQFEITGGSSAVGRPLSEITMPRGARLAGILRDGEVSIPDSSSVINEGDEVVLVADAPSYDAARKIFHEEKKVRRSIVVLGGTRMAEWVCRTLRGKPFAIRLFERDREVAERLAAELDWVTVLHGDVTDPAMFAEERIAEADHFVALLEDDEVNIIGGVLAKLRGVDTVTVVVQRSAYLDSVYSIGLDRAYSPRTVAAKQIEEALDVDVVRTVSSLADGGVSVFRVGVGAACELAGKRLRTVKLTPDWSVLAVQRGEKTWVPHADDEVLVGDEVLVLGRTEHRDRLVEIFDAG